MIQCVSLPRDNAIYICDAMQTDAEKLAGKDHAAVWGAAYHIPASHAQEVHDYLDDREIDGYTVHYTPFHPTVPGTAPGTEMTCMVYIGLPSNPQFLRDAERRDPQHVASVISQGHGMSGKNSEYLYLLEKALEGLGLGTADIHVTDLVRRVRAMDEATAREGEEEAERDLSRLLSGTENERERKSIE